MVRELLNMILEPFYKAFAVFDPSTNLFQTVCIVIFIVGIISWIYRLLK